MTDKLKVLDLFSGIGGFSLGLERTGGFETVAFCEIEEFPRRVLAKHWPEVPCFEDVRELKGSDIGAIDVICGGYPCQPFSTAGKRRGKEDDRHLWPEFMRLVVELRPTWVIGENVAGHISMGLDDVLFDLEAEGYAARPFVIPACAKDAKHRRDRVWTVAYAESERRSQKGGPGPRPQKRASRTSATSDLVADAKGKQGSSSDHFRKQGGSCQSQQGEFGGSGRGVSVSNTRGIGSQGQGGAIKQVHSKSYQQGEVDRVEHDGGWPAEPNVGRVANGVLDGMDRLAGLGNAVVPQIPEMIGHAILESMKHD